VLARAIPAALEELEALAPRDGPDR
jgi:hypothetical protein